MTDSAREIAERRALLAEREAELATARAESTGARLQIEQMKAQLAKLRRMQFGRSSERLDAQIHQVELMLEDLEEGEAARTAPSLVPGADQAGRRKRERRQPVRRPLPDHLPREEIVHSTFRGVIQADAFSGYESLTRAEHPRPPRILHAACWAHARRKLYDVFEGTRSPIAQEALRRIGELSRTAVVTPHLIRHRQSTNDAFSS